MNREDWNRMAGKAHIELRDPSIGVSIEEMKGGKKRVNIVLGTEPFEVNHHPFNGAALIVDVDWIDGAIDQLQRAKELHRVEMIRDFVRPPLDQEPMFPNVPTATIRKR